VRRAFAGAAKLLHREVDASRLCHSGLARVGPSNLQCIFSGCKLETLPRVITGLRLVREYPEQPRLGIVAHMFCVHCYLGSGTVGTPGHATDACDRSGLRSV